LFALVLPVIAAKKPPPLPALPPLELPADAPVITAMIDGMPLVLRVDPATTNDVSINASAARRLDLGNRGRLVAGEPADFGRAAVDVGKVRVDEVTTDAILDIAGRPVRLRLAFGESDHVDGADGSINPVMLPHDEVRLVRRAATAADQVTVLPVEFSRSRGMLTETPVGRHRIDVIITPMARETIATSAAAAFLAEVHGGQLSGPVRDALITHGVIRPVRDVRFTQAVDLAGFRFTSIPARVFDWSGKTRLPSEPQPDDEIVATARFDGQRQWAKLAIGADKLTACASLVWRRLPSTLTLTCPRL
jgi:hypothetical protein